MKKILIIIGAVLLAVLLSAGSFYGGMAYQRNQQNQIQARFFQSRGLPGGGFENGGGFGNNGSDSGQRRSFFGGGGVTGQVKSLDGNTLIISTAQNTTTVNLTGSTQIEKPATGSTADLQPGVRVVVNGQTGADGNITADQITIINPNLLNPQATTTP